MFGLNMKHIIEALIGCTMAIVFVAPEVEKAMAEKPAGE